MSAQLRIAVSVLAAIVTALAGLGIFVLPRMDAEERATIGEAERQSLSRSEASEDAEEFGDEQIPRSARVPASEDIRFPEFDVTQFKSGTLDLQLTVDPVCVRHGETITAFLKAVPGAHVALQVSYAGVGQGPYYVGPVAPDGTLTYPWAVSPDAEEGQGIVMAVARDEENDKSGTIAAEFRVLRQGENC